MTAAKPRKSKAVKTRYHHGELRQALIDEALRLIREHGPDGFTLREAARRIGVSHSAPYRHFADKDALLIAIAETGFVELHARGLAASAAADPHPRAQLQAFGLAYLRFAHERPSQYRVMFGRAIARPTDALRQAGGQAFELLVRQVGAVVGDRCPTEIRDLAMAVMSGVHGLSMLAIDGMLADPEDADGSRFEALCTVTLKLIDAGLPGRSRPSPS